MFMTRLWSHLFGAPVTPYLATARERCPRCGVNAGGLCLLTSVTVYLVCSACDHRWQHSRLDEADADEAE